ncbi:PDZ and LIM domain protein 2 [Ophiophagus hannah]|uniref:PDZ and LIM domain protein 2 n=1 Tax=Ophiophagus hannah TaxID=8665 RepID=V8NGH9_OPHHA|nr:PDZ and LIM domain protein 2 [Ophiophagus hannah]
MSVSVNLTGPAPWGFRITGGRDFRKPIIVSKVIEHGKAALGDLRPGDVIISINGESTSEMLNVEAQNKIKQSPGQLQLQVDRSSPALPLLKRPCSPKEISIAATETLYEDVWCQQLEHWQAEDVVRTKDNGQNSVRSSYSSPASISPRPTSPYSPSSPGYRPGSPYSPVRPSLPSEIRGEPVINSRSLDTEPTMNHLEGDSEVYKLMQENRDTRAAPRQSSTFRLLQVALELDEKEGTASHFPSQLSPSLHKPVSSATAGNTQKLHTCEKCDSPITYQAVKIQENRYRHPSCYVCTDCGLNLKMRGHFWVGEEMYCEKHARQRYQSPAEGGTVLAVYSQS